MQKIFLAIIIFGLIASGCHTAQKAQHVVRDTVSTSSPAKELKPVDSTEFFKEQLSNKINTPLDFTTFYAKAKADFSSPQASGNATVYIKIKKDSLIWISITGPLNIEGARILVTPDSVKMINKLENSAQLSSIAHLQQITKLPLTFGDFQNIILGRPIVANADLGLKMDKDSITVTVVNEVLRYIYAFTKNNLLLGQSNLQTQNSSAVNSANIFYSNYQKVNDIDFATNRDITVAGSSPARLQLNFKEYNFNQPQTFVFTISKNYTIKYE